MDVWCGLDFGARVDYSAVSVLSRSLALDDKGLPRRNTRDRPLYDWQVRSLLRFDLRTPYPVICEKVARIATMREWGPHVRVCCDSTGVGIATSEMMRTALARYPHIPVWGCSITSGNSHNFTGRHTINVSKTQLMGAFAEVVDSGRFQVCRRQDGTTIRGTELLLRELRAFKVRQTRAGNETSGAEGKDHDDMCLSCALPVFVGGLPQMIMDTTPLTTDVIEWMPPRERAALEAEQTALALQRVADEKAEEEREANRRLASWQVKRRTEEEI
jgi:hypothetical protein